MPEAPEPTVRWVALVAQLGFVVVAALLVYGFVGVTKEGETRRVCSAPCFLHPDYMAADRKAPDFSLKDLRGGTVTLQSLRGKRGSLDAPRRLLELLNSRAITLLGRSGGSFLRSLKMVDFAARHVATMISGV